MLIITQNHRNRMKVYFLDFFFKFENIYSSYKTKMNSLNGETLGVLKEEQIHNNHYSSCCRYMYKHTA